MFNLAPPGGALKCEPSSYLLPKRFSRTAVENPLGLSQGCSSKWLLVVLGWVAQQESSLCCLDVQNPELSSMVLSIALRVMSILIKK